MKITPITSPTNPLIKTIRGLHRRAHREKTGLFVLEGSKLVNEASRHGTKLKEIVVSQSFLKAGLGDVHAAEVQSMFVVDDEQFSELTTMDSPEGILAVVEMPRPAKEQLFRGRAALVVIADGIQDPGNLGTILRTALAAGAQGAILAKGCVDAFNPKVVRSAAGALFMLPMLSDISVADAIALCKQRNVSVVACDARGTKPYWQADFTRPTALVFGNEGQGSAQAVLSAADETVTIPMIEGSESLNVAVSAGIILYCAVQQRQLAQAL